MTIPRIGVTLGDPAGIGPEVALKALSDASSLPKARFTLFGNTRWIKEEMKSLGLNPESLFQKTSSKQDLPEFSIHEIQKSPESIKKGLPSPENGMFSFLAFETAVREAQNHNLQAIITAPISKHSWEKGGIKWAGHTDFLQSFYPKAIMSFWSKKLKVALFSHHVSLMEAVKKIEKNALLDFICALDMSLQTSKPNPFKIYVAGLNPHAGESGLLGQEEEKEIIPAIEEAQNKGLNIHGPLSPDVIFRKALSIPDAIIVALYHDQGLIPFKLEAFDKGVNATLGLPFVRTSPDHGTAFDIAGKGLADPTSMIEAVHLAYDFL